MNVFTDVYEKCIDLLQTKSLDDSWKLIEADLKQLLDPTGPDVAKAVVLESLRTTLKTAAKGKGSGNGAVADEIIKASRSGSSGYQDRAALVKTMQHLYMVQKKGGQSVWVVDPPKSYAKWTFDQFSGKTSVELKTELCSSDEVFGSGNRKMMSDAHQLARKWAADVQRRVADADAKTRERVARWFVGGEASGSGVDSALSTLSDGFKKIHATLNSGTVIFSDRPHLRASGDWDEAYASVNAADVMPVIYIYQVFLSTGKRNKLGNIPKLWLCALTIVHELSHKLMNTDDISYDHQGLKPGGVNLPANQALKNADSWGYFAADMAGALSKGTIKEVLK